MRKLTVLFALLLLAGGPGAARAEDSPRPPAAAARHYLGVIGTKHVIELTLAGLVPGEVTGTYAYLHIGSPLQVNGTVAADGSFNLRERDGQGTVTGQFEGAFKGRTGSGIWSTPDGRRSLGFELLEVDSRPLPVTVPAAAAGRYARSDGNADLRVDAAGGTVLSVTGNAFWSPSAGSSVIHIGEVAGNFPIAGHVLRVKETPEVGQGCEMTLHFVQGGLAVTDDNMHCGGFNVVFNGLYRKAAPSSQAP